MRAFLFFSLCISLLSCHSNRSIGPLNIKYMNRAYFYASSPENEEYAGFGGWAGSDNNFHPISGLQNFEDNALSILVNPDEKNLISEKIQGIKMYLANTARDTFIFDAQDSRLYLILQARAPNGKWRDIEYLPNSWCGNSYHGLFLPPGHYWEFSIPVYEGAIKTKLRGALYNFNAKGKEQDRVLYSNEFAGSVNRGQFRRKKAYNAVGLMHPYSE